MTNLVPPPASAVDPWGNLPEFSFAFQLYITGVSALSTRAVVNVRRFLESHLAGRYELEVIDLAKFPARAVEAQIVASPTLVKTRPEPVRRFVGDLSRADALRSALGLPEGTTR